ncbi:MAG: NAD-dependent epimerase/dehydratase family protein [Sediminibacterium sp.]
MNFVTGATGLIGSHLVLRLAEEGMPVTALFRNENGKSDVLNLFHFYGKEVLFQQLLWVKGDVEDVDDMYELTEGMHTVFHCAAIVSYHKKEASRMLEVNINGTKNVVNACIENEVKHFIHVSSISALGDSKGGIINEETPRDFNDYHSNYSKGKYLSEQEVWRGIQEGLNATILNPAIIFGPNNCTRSSGTMIARIEKGLPALPAGGSGIVSVLDVVEVMIRAAKQEPTNERYILCAENIRMSELFTKIAAALHVKIGKNIAKRWQIVLVFYMEALVELFSGKRATITREIIRNYDEVKQFDGSKATRIFGFQYRDTFSSIEDTVRYYKVLSKGAAQAD